MTWTLEHERQAWTIVAMMFPLESSGVLRRITSAVRAFAEKQPDIWAQAAAELAATQSPGEVAALLETWRKRAGGQ